MRWYRFLILYLLWLLNGEVSCCRFFLRGPLTYLPPAVNLMYIYWRGLSTAIVDFRLADSRFSTLHKIVTLHHPWVEVIWGAVSVHNKYFPSPSYIYDLFTIYSNIKAKVQHLYEVIPDIWLNNIAFVGFNSVQPWLWKNRINTRTECRNWK